MPNTIIFSIFATVKFLFIALGTLSFALGMLGVILPVLPTTPFLLLSATLFMHSSPRLYDWLLSNRYFGPMIRNYREHRVISLKAKIMAMITLWATIIFSIYKIGCEHLYLQITLLVVAIGVSWHILWHKSTIN